MIKYVFNFKIHDLDLANKNSYIENFNCKISVSKEKSTLVSNEGFMWLVIENT